MFFYFLPAQKYGKTLVKDDRKWAPEHTIYLSCSPEMRRWLCGFHEHPAQWTRRGLQTPDRLTYSHQYIHVFSYSTWFLRASLILLCFLLPNFTAVTVFRVGVVGPWSCDPLFAKAYPSTAARLAISRINKDPSLSSGVTFDYVILEEECKTSQALSTFLSHYNQVSGFIGPVNPGYCDAASLLGKSWNKPVFSWSCVGFEMEAIRSHPTFVYTIPVPTLVLLRLMQHFRWAHVGILSSSDDIWIETASKVANSLRSHGMPVGIVASIGKNATSVRKSLVRIRKIEDLRCKFNMSLEYLNPYTYYLDWLFLSFLF